MGKFLMVLQDGTTFTSLEGCKIVEVPDDWDEDYLPEAPPTPAKFDNTSMYTLHGVFKVKK